MSERVYSRPVEPLGYDIQEGISFADRIRGLSQNWKHFKILPLQGSFADRIRVLSQKNWEALEGFTNIRLFYRQN